MLAEYWRGEITLRQLRVLIEGLPPGSALGRAQAGHHWGDVEMLLAALVDAVQMQTASLARVQGARGVKKPAPLPRPTPAPEIEPEPDDTEEDDPETGRPRTAREAHQALRDRLAARGGG